MLNTKLFVGAFSQLFATAHQAHFRSRFRNPSYRSERAAKMRRKCDENAGPKCSLRRTRRALILRCGTTLTNLVSWAARGQRLVSQPVALEHFWRPINSLPRFAASALSTDRSAADQSQWRLRQPRPADWLSNHQLPACRAELRRLLTASWDVFALGAKTRTGLRGDRMEMRVWLAVRLGKWNVVSVDEDWPSS